MDLQPEICGRGPRHFHGLKSASFFRALNERAGREFAAKTRVQQPRPLLGDLRDGTHYRPVDPSASQRAM